MSILDTVGGLFDKVSQGYTQYAQLQNAYEDTGVQRIVAQAELEKNRAAAEKASAESAAALSRNETLKNIALYGSIAVSAITIGGYIFSKKKKR